MAYCDFVVRYDPKVDKPLDLTKRILYSIIIKRLKAKKPAVCFVSGDSGEGKSWSVLRLMELLMEIQGLDLKDYLDDVNVYTPLEYPKKLDALLNDKRLKKINIFGVHEARTIVKAKNWNSFLTQAVADVNAMSRSVKRIAFFIVSQFIRDITTDVRYTLNFYMKVSRPKNKKARLYINVMWKDDRDLEKPKLRKRKLSGYLVYPDGKYRRFVPQYLEMSSPSKETVKIFEENDSGAKKLIIRRKLDKLVREMEADMSDDSKKLDIMVDHYSSNINNLSQIGRKIKNVWKVKPDFREMHGLTMDEGKDFELKLNKKLKDMKVIDDG